MTADHDDVPSGYYDLPDMPGNQLDLPIVFPSGADLNTPELVQNQRLTQLEMAAALRAGFDQNRDRRLARIGSLIPGGIRDNTVLLMTLNLGHLCLLQNWLRSCERNNLDPRDWALVVALDEQAYAEARALGFVCYLDPASYGEYETSAAGRYGDATFSRIMFPKTAVVQDLLDLGWDVLFQDVDMIWRRDPRGFLLHAERRHLDAQFMYDGPNQYYQPLYANTGFFLLKNTPKSRWFWGKVLDEFDKMLWYGSQQRVVNIILPNHFFRGLRLSLLPESDFANGHLFSIDAESRLPADPAVIHCSWTANLAHKIAKLKLARLWYL